MGIDKQITFHATNEREKNAIEKYFPDGKIYVADNLPDTIQPPFKTCIKITGTLNCIFIARIVPIKNLLFLLQALQQVKENIYLTIIGPVENETYWAECKTSIQKLPKNIMVNYEGAVENIQLQKILQQQHLYILPTTGENFGHSIFEAMLAGRPVLISNQTPWLNLQKANAGWDLPLDERERFTSVIKEMALYNQEQFDALAKGAWAYANNFIGNPQLNLPYQQLFA